MEENIEIELKTLVNKAQFELLLGLYKGESDEFVTQVNNYYDTTDFYCKSNNIAVRTRDIEDITLFTLKYKDELLHEFEKVVDSYFLDDIEVIEILKRFNIEPCELVNYCSLTTNRCEIDLANAHLCFDINTYNDICDYEIEYEYKNNEASINDFQSILSNINLIYTENCASKITRAYNSKKIQ